MKKQLLIVIIIAVVVIGVGVILFKQESKTAHLKVTQDENSDATGESFPNQGQEHIAIGASHDPYNSNPPTSGPHYVQPADWGVYERALPDEQLVHNLEHGGIWISYKDIDADTKSKLEAVAKANPGSVIVTPRSANDVKIAVASWTRLMKLDSYDETKILDFIKANKNKSPEPLAQ
jgi:hypothetical protein